MYYVKELPLNHRTPFGVVIKSVQYYITQHYTATQFTINYSWWSHRYPDVHITADDIANVLHGAKIVEFDSYTKTITLTYNILMSINDFKSYLQAAFDKLSQQAESLIEKSKEVYEWY